MPSLCLDKAGERKIKRLDRKGSTKFHDRFKKTADHFAKDMNANSLGFMAVTAAKRIYKLRLLGANDGYRVYMRRISDHDYLVFNITDHDALEKQRF